jgi:hypothetical protein
MLALHGATDAAELGRRIVVEAAVRFDLSAQKTEKGSKVVVEER